MRIVDQFLGFMAVVVGVKNKASIVKAFQQHNSRRRNALFGRRCDGHRVGFGKLCLDGLIKPALKLHKRIRVNLRFVEFLKGVVFSEVSDR